MTSRPWPDPDHIHGPNEETMMSDSPKPDWRWYAGWDDEHYEIGPCDSRDEAIELATEAGWESVTVCEAHQRPLRLADWFEADDFLYRAEEDAIDFSNPVSNPDGELLFDVPDDARARLETAVRAAIEAWQDAEGLVFLPHCFTATRNEESIVLVEPEEDEAPEGRTHD